MCFTISETASIKALRVNMGLGVSMAARGSVSNIDCI
jgi:hypothetical protein